MITDPTKRFTDKVDNYVKYRPTYPDEVITYLKEKCNLQSDSLIADIGAGTGIFTTLLLSHGYKVLAVEPNDAMREAAIRQLGVDKNFIPVNGTAEATTLQPGSIDLVVCAQAFHWFNDRKTRVEFNRILKEDGYATLIWNNRVADADEFSIAYEELLKRESIDYNTVNHRNIGDIDFKAFFRDGEYRLITYPNAQVFDKTALMGRVFSSSYVPTESTEAGEKFREILSGLFDKYNNDGTVSFYYQTEIYLGKV